jgi:hypothetical protein
MMTYMMINGECEIMLAPVTKLDKLYAFLELPAATEALKGSHSVLTPRALVEEIIDKVPTKGNILVLFNVEWVISLIHKYGVDPATITFYSDNKTSRHAKFPIVDKLDLFNFLVSEGVIASAA